MCYPVTAGNLLKDIDSHAKQLVLCLKMNAMDLLATLQARYFFLLSLIKNLSSKLWSFEELLVNPEYEFCQNSHF